MRQGMLVMRLPLAFRAAVQAHWPGGQVQPLAVDVQVEALAAGLVLDARPYWSASPVDQMMYADRSCPTGQRPGRLNAAAQRIARHQQLLPQPSEPVKDNVSWPASPAPPSMAGSRRSTFLVRRLKP